MEQPLDAQQGLLAQGIPQQQPQAAEGQGEPATPEEQAAYEKMIDNAMRTLHGPQSTTIVEKLAQGDPAEAIAEVTVGLIIKLFESAQQAGKPLPESVLMHGGEEILNEVINMGLVAGVFDFDEEEGETIQQEAFFIALDKFGQYYEQVGEVNPDELNAGLQAAQAGAFDQQP